MSNEFERSKEVADIFAQDTDHKAQFEALSLLCNKYLPVNASGSVNTHEIIKIIDTVIALETGSMVVSRQFVSLITDRLDNEQLDPQSVKIIAEGILGIIKTRTISYEDQVCILRLMLANLYEKEGRIKDAAQALIGINSDTSNKFNGPASRDGAKAALFVRITKLLLDCNEIDEAEQYVNRTSIVMVDVQNQEVIIEHKALQARVSDAKRRFVEAAQRYYELSATDALPQSDRMTALGKAIVCVLLAKPGLQRSRLLTIIFKDERAPACPSFELIAKMYLTKVIHKDELAEFEQQLQPHQKVDQQGESILKEVIQEHNITAISQLYININFSTLGALLGVSSDSAEAMAGEMISSERLHGYIDQVDGVLHFEDVNPMRMWDSQILSTLEQVNKVSDMIVARHPEFAKHLS